MVFTFFLTLRGSFLGSKALLGQLQAAEAVEVGGVFTEVGGVILNKSNRLKNH